MLATPDTPEFKIAAALAEEFVKLPLKYVGPSEFDGTDSYCEIDGFTIYEDRKDPVTVQTLVGPRVVPDRFRLIIDATHTYPATYWEPETDDEVRVGKADNLIAAVRLIAHVLLDQSLDDCGEEHHAFFTGEDCE
jgi:hypothetical protein